MFEVKEWVVFVIILGAKYRILGCKMSNLGVQNVEFGSAKRRKSGAKYRIGRAKYRMFGAKYRMFWGCFAMFLGWNGRKKMVGIWLKKWRRDTFRQKKIWFTDGCVGVLHVKWWWCMCEKFKKRGFRSIFSTEIRRFQKRKYGLQRCVEAIFGVLSKISNYRTVETRKKVQGELNIIYIIYNIKLFY